MVGEIRIFAGTSIPEGWLLCDGSYLDSNAYLALFSVIGNTFGGKSGKFRIPELKGPVDDVTAKLKTSVNGMDANHDVVVALNQNKNLRYIIQFKEEGLNVVQKAEVQAMIDASAQTVPES